MMQHLVSSLSVSGRPVHRTATDREWRYQMQVCIKLVIVQDYTKMDGQQNKYLLDFLSDKGITKLRNVGNYNLNDVMQHPAV